MVFLFLAFVGPVAFVVGLVGMLIEAFAEIGFLANRVNQLQMTRVLLEADVANSENRVVELLDKYEPEEP